MALHSGTAITVNGKEVPSGSSSTSIPLAEGDNLLSVVATSMDGSAEMTYTVLARRATTVNAVLTGSAAAPVTAPGYMAANNSIHLTLAHAPVMGATLKVIDNTGLNPIEGEFTNLAHGQLVHLPHNQATFSYVADYFGGTGNDLVLRWAETKVYAWGSNFVGQLGDGTTTIRNQPTPVVATGVLAGKRVTRLSVGGGHNLAVCADGTVATWRRGAMPTPVDASGTLWGKTVTAAAGGSGHWLVLCSDGSLHAWGANAEGQLGNGTIIPSDVLPVAVTATGVLAGKTVTGIGCGARHNLVMCSDRSLIAWGYNWGSLGNNANAASVPAGTQDVAITAAAVDQAATIRINGTVVASGAPTAAIPLPSLPTTVTVEVIAPNGTAVTTYRVIINNSAPWFSGYEAATAHQQAADLALAKILANASDAEGDAVTLVDAGPAANGGTVVLQAASIRFIPRAGFSGVDTFPVVLRDARGATTTGTVTIHVGPAPADGGVGANRPRLTALPGGKIGVAFHGIPGRTYTVQRSISGLDHWETLATVVADAGGRISFIDDEPPPDSAFYRMGAP